VRFCVVSNPEFLKEGSAVVDFMNPDRIVVGADDESGFRIMRRIYRPLVRYPGQWLEMDLASAEFTKYACNAMLATRISLMNEFALLAERLGVDIEQVRTGMGSDPRIGHQALAPGCGFGGSCLPKDLRALAHTAEAAAQPLRLLQAVERVNDEQKTLLARRVIEHYGERLEGRRIAVWGLSFKPGTDDMREAPSLAIIRLLSERGANVVAHDPVAVPAARRLLDRLPGVDFAADPAAALDQADALLIVTEWREYRELDLGRLGLRMRAPLIFDGRNQFDPETMAAQGLVYRSIGRPTLSVRGAPRGDALAQEPLAQPLKLGPRTMARHREGLPVLEQPRALQAIEQ
jgi:UDPglucose 6-dehydrogenase